MRDIMFSDGDAYPAGPFDNVAAFNDAFAQLSARGGGVVRKSVPELAGLDDDVPVVFTHADLDLSNTLVSKRDDGPIRVVAIIDWHQAGWYPQPWEWLKANTIADPDSDWKSNYLHKVVDPPKIEYLYSREYVSMLAI